MDSEERAKNLYITLNYLMENIDAEYIMPIQYRDKGDVEEILTFIKKSFPPNIKILELYQDTPCHKTQLTNMGVFEAKNEIIMLYDLDVIIDATQLKNAVDYMSENSIDLLFPYTNPAYDVPYNVKDYLTDYKNIDLDVVRKIVPPRTVRPSNGRKEPEIGFSPGWCVMFTKDSYIESGGDNEDYMGACSEDSERIYRYVNLGFKCERFEGDVFHLEHPRHQVENELEHHKKNSYFYENTIKDMSQDELKTYFSNKKDEILKKYKG